MVRVRQAEFFVILCRFLLFYPPNNPPPNKKKKKKKIEKKKKTPGDIIILLLYTTNNLMMYGSWDMECGRQNCLSRWTIFVHLSSKQRGESRFWKNEQNSWRYHHFIYMYRKWKSYDVWSLRYGAWQMEFFFSFWTVFCPFASQTTQKTRILKKCKKSVEILFYPCVL